MEVDEGYIRSIRGKNPVSSPLALLAPSFIVREVMAAPAVTAAAAAAAVIGSGRRPEAVGPCARRAPPAISARGRGGAAALCSSLRQECGAPGRRVPVGRPRGLNSNFLRKFSFNEKFEIFC